MGKIRTDEKIVKKPGALDENEIRLMRLHPELGAEILQDMPGIHPGARAMVLQHHVRFDRKGYPKLPPGAEIHPLAEAIALADCYDALTTTRPYQRSRYPSEAARIIHRISGSAFSPKMTDLFTDLLGIYPMGDTVRLSTGEIAVIVAINPLDATNPIVRVVSNADGKRLTESRRVALSDPSESKREIVMAIDPLLKDIDIAAVLEEDLASEV